jgi:hypothetical protein
MRLAVGPSPQWTSMGMAGGMNHGISVPFMPKIRDAEKVSA